MYLNNPGATYSWGMTLNAGEVAFTSSGDYGAGVLTNSVFGTGTLTLNGGTLRSSSDTSGRNIANRVILGGDVQLGKSGAAATLTFNNTGGGTTTLATNLTLTTVADVSYLQEISGSNYRLTKAGSGILSLDASNNIAGVDVSAGKISYRNRNAFGTGLMTLADGVTLGQSNNINNPNLSGNSRLDRSLVNDLRLDGNVTFGSFGNASYFGGNMNLNGATRTITLGNTTHIYGTITNGGMVIDNGAADGASRTLGLYASNSYSGGTVVRSNAILAAGHDSALGSGNLTFTNTTLGNAVTATLRASTISTAASQLRAINNDIAISTNVTVALDGVTTVQNATGTDVAVNVDMNLSGRISGSGGLNKTGANAVTLSGSNDYTGNTTVSSGTLVVNGSIANSATTVQSGATLKGSGSVGALEIASGGTLAPGNSPGTLTAASVVWNGGGTYDWEINNFLGTAGTNYDFLNVTGALTISADSGNKFIIDVISLLAADNTAGNASNFNAASNYTFAIATAAGGIVGFDASGFDILTTNFSNPMGSPAGSWSITQNGNSINLNYASAIPEPSTGSLVVGGILALLAAKRRRRS